MRRPSEILLFVALLAAGAACGGPAALAVEVVPGEERSRPESTVEVYRNGPPKRPFVLRYLVDLTLPVSAGAEAFSRARELGAKLGCDAVVVYTPDHPVINSPAPSEEHVLAIGMDGLVAWRKLGFTVDNRRAVFLQGPRSTMNADAPFALCIAFAKAEQND